VAEPVPDSVWPSITTWPSRSAVKPPIPTIRVPRAPRTGRHTSSVPRHGTASISSSATAFHPVPSDPTAPPYERGPTVAPARANMARNDRALRTAKPSQSLLK
jgi:hypothetical protein